VGESRNERGNIDFQFKTLRGINTWTRKRPRKKGEEDADHEGGRPQKASVVDFPREGGGYRMDFIVQQRIGGSTSTGKTPTLTLKKKNVIDKEVLEGKKSMGTSRSWPFKRSQWSRKTKRRAFSP